MDRNDGHNIDAWLDTANRDLVTSTAAEVDVEGTLAQIRQRAANLQKMNRQAEAVPTNAADVMTTLPVATPDPVTASAPMATPHHRAIVLVDIEGSTARTNIGRAWLRQSMYDLLKRALRASRIAEHHRDPLIDRGDGVLVLIHPVQQVPKTVLLNIFVPTLSRLIG